MIPRLWYPWNHTSPHKTLPCVAIGSASLQLEISRKASKNSVLVVEDVYQALPIELKIDFVISVRTLDGSEYPREIYVFGMAV